MQKIRVVASMKPPWIIPTSSFDRGLCNEITRDRCLVVSPPALSMPTFRSMHFTRANSTFTANTDEVKRNIFMRMLYKLGLPEPGKYQRKMMGYLLYEDVVSNVNFANFFKGRFVYPYRKVSLRTPKIQKGIYIAVLNNPCQILNYSPDFKMPDTFYSWFVIMELHVWMLMIRYMAEGKQGHEIRNNIVEAMWADVNKRKSKLKNANVTALRKQVDDLSQQFNAAIIGYDEGIMSDDKVLAGALWRRFFQCEGNNPEDLEKLLIYVRKQVNELDRMSREECLSKKSIKWIDYRNP